MTLASERRPDLVIHDLLRSSGERWALLDRLRAENARTPLIVLAPPDGNGTVIEAAKRGAYDFVWKPIDYVRLRELVRGALARSSASPTKTAATPARRHCPAEVLLGSSGPMQELYKEIARASPRDVAVLIVGETGTGKSLTARTIHRHGPRRAERFASIDLSGMPVERLERELFGYERGAFAGAHARRLGWLERSGGGTLLLEEIDQLPPRVQGQLVGLFEQRRLRRVGGEAALAPDVRILAATRHELGPLVADSRFRADLYYHLDNFTIRVPPLRERLADLPELVDYFWTRITPDAEELPGANRELLDVLAEHRWPGNLWELQSVVYQMFWRSRGQALSPDSLPDALRPARTATVAGADPGPTELQSLDEIITAAFQGNGAGELYTACVAVFDRYLCSRVLTHTGGNQSRAARILGMTRRSLRTKIRRWAPAPKPKKKSEQKSKKVSGTVLDGR